ncbi:WD40 repeat domain-containing protein [Marinobacterium arenosum]|uniref:WD40 repeat domain-containing protein n=1 Tax=Marinobacterium arenosum TaxID=2862496 RepID=UPI001C951BF5|nr:hypothetical protein [Marinobacterium arenosum]MBY4675512.1 hypothetical protein [Marinobacterium arenosum]
MQFSVPQYVLAATTALALAGCSGGEPPAAWKEYAKQGAYSAAISPAGDHVSLGSSLHGGSLWDLRKHARLFNWNHHAQEYSLIAATAFSPEGDYAVTANPQDLVLWSVTSGQPQGFWSSPAEILDVALSSNGDYALLGLADHTAVYFDVKNGGARNVFRHPARVRSVALSEDGKLALTGSDDYRVRLWDMTSGGVLHSLPFDNVVDTVALSHDGRRAFSSATLNRAVIWDTANGQELVTLTSDKRFFAQRISYLSARFSKDGRQLLTGSASGLVQLWEVASGKELRRWQVHKRDPYGPTHTGVYDVAFGSGKYYAIGSNGILNELQ